MEKKRVNIDIDRDLWKKVGILAARKDMPKREVVEEALKLYIKEKHA